MIRGIHAKIFLWFCLTLGVLSVATFAITVALHSQSLGPRWMTGVLNLYGRSAVDIYTHSGKEGLREYLDEISESSEMETTLLDPQSHDILGRGLPPGTEDILAAAQKAGQSRFRTGLRWIGAAVISTDAGNYILVARVRPFRGAGHWAGLRTPISRLVVALLVGAFLSLLLSQHIASPIRTLQAAARQIADGDLSVRASPAFSSRNDELTDLAKDFDRMADRIQSLLQKQHELLGDISHELRSPLTRLSVSLELVRRGEADAAEQMQADLDRLETLIGQILTLTRLQAYREQRIETAVNLRSILESVAADANFEGKGEGKSVWIAHSEDCGTRGDQALLRSCIENIVRNAIQHTKPLSNITLSLNVIEDLESRVAKILVADNGDGVPPEALPRLFEPFYRVPKPLGCETVGSGLGLSIAQRIVLLHGGRIVARNGNSTGLEVEIVFPVLSLNTAIAKIGFKE